MRSESQNLLTRRGALRIATTSSAFVLAGMAGPLRAAEAEKSKAAAASITAPVAVGPPQKGRIKQAICGGVLKSVKSLEEKAQICAKLGVKGIDLLGPSDFPTLKKYNLICTMVSGGNLKKGYNHKENHEACIAASRKSIDAAAEAGFPNVICFSGNREGISDEEGWKNCAEGLKQVVGYAEQKKVTLCMELLNSKRNHKDYQCDHTAWGAELCKRVGSPSFKLLYDIFHMQIMEGDVISTLRENIQYIGHIHTAGVPGRHEIDESQELYYPAIMRALADAGYQGYVAHEYSPAGDAIPALEKALRLCDV